MKSDPLEIMLVHDRWATGNLLDACGALTQDQFHQSFEMGPGSLHATFTHMLAAMRAWGDLLAGRDNRPRLEQTGPYTPAELRTMLDEIHADFAASARNHPVAEKLSREREGRTYTFTRGGVVTQVLTHGMHHRAQCLNMLRQLGVKPLPPSAVVEWIVMEDSA